MKWFNLKRNKCPSCGKDLTDKIDGNFFRCPCGFKISFRRFKEITSSQTTQDLDRYFDQMEEARQKWS